jgi:hypothetical protein
MRPEHEAANQMLQCFVDGDREGWRKIRDSLPADIKPFVRAREQEQRLMFKEHRYYGWCNVRPGNK